MNLQGAKYRVMPRGELSAQSRACDFGDYDEIPMDSDTVRQHFPQGFDVKTLPDALLYSTRASCRYESPERQEPIRKYDEKRMQWVTVAYKNVVTVTDTLVEFHFYVDNEGTIMKCVPRTVTHTRVEDTAQREYGLWEAVDGLVHLLDKWL